MTKYLIAAIPLIACVEVISYACLCAIAVMFIADLLVVGRG